ncbi:DUF1059 domain-containing protein [Corallococcus sp. CA054B]|uniref:DUF1059 domain-containing protein n=1 Tax=Corallococcus coralloides (strain ATCC 25202 / DSM 2259 / NBRC 100086 / M2) TaxID=1144275 RepID=H8MTR8_CORCM|nr:MULTISPECIES: DUF1059 domain-containing protein [Corallococcus]AFE04034.1 hypothetical protein COCOR_01394 [Corallococcus coralloides DSM 2259]RKG69417.1 DUF1059 domain-containing protein [Corallococcus sp. CA054B]
MSRKTMDCREAPSESNCSLTITGEEDEVLRAAVEHAVSVHGEKDSPELREMIRGSLKDEAPMGAPMRSPEPARPGMQ